MSFFTLTSTAYVSLTADAGPDQNAGCDVPIILDAAGSRDSDGATLTYLWEQTSGTPRFDIVGQDRSRAVVMSAHTPGAYKFQVTVGNGTTTTTDTMTLTISAPTGTARYVDGTLSADTETYSIANRNDTGSDGNGYKTLQAAADASAAGDTIYIRAGTYQDGPAVGGIASLLKISHSGTATAPIRYQSYNSEKVILRGGGFEDRDLNGDGNADGSLVSGTENLIWVQNGANYTQIVGLEITNSGTNGILVESQYNYLAEISIHDNWKSGIFIQNPNSTGDFAGCVMRWIESYRNRHGSGITIYHPENIGDATTTNYAVVDSLLYNNGFQPDGIRVLAAAGDPAGGGNSDGFTISKFNVSSDGTQFYSRGHFLVRNISYHNADDGFDVSFRDSLLEDNYTVGNGPTAGQGFKVFKQTKGLLFRGNVSYFNLARGIDNRYLVGETNSAWHNTVLSNQNQGIFSFGAGSSVKDNLTAFNVQTDFSASDGGGHNWAEDGVNVSPPYIGDPQLVNATLGNPLINNTGGGGTNTNPSANYFLDLGFNPTDSVATKLEYVRSQIRNAFAPTSTSGVIDAGVLIPGYDCPTADDSGSPPAADDPRRHWYGSAPDIGAFEYNPSAPTPTPTPSPTPLINQGFEGPGYDKGETWTPSGTGTIDPDSTGSPIVGSESLHITTTAQAGSTIVSFPAQDNVYGFCRLRWTSHSTHGLIAFANSAGAERGILSILDGTNTIRAIAVGGASADGSTGMPVGTDLYVWFEYEKGTGLNTVFRVGWSTDGTKPDLSATGAQVARCASGTSTDQIANLMIGSPDNVTNDFYVDRVLVSTAPIGSNP
ncbi:MAG: hypothetical protein H0V54_01665 [Chthoniobacterales bacterium]|nr:hypothetical protein [Chthoniobacterales bacterium]